MSERDKDKDDSGPCAPDRGGRKEGGVPDYEKNQSTPNDDKDFDNSKTSW